MRLFRKAFRRHTRWATYEKDGKVTRAAGGDYALKGEVYEETPEYGITSTEPRAIARGIEKTHWASLYRFKVSLQG